MKTSKFKSCLTILIIICSGMNAQDWAGLSRYQSENAKLLSAPKGERRIVFMGNSITEGWIKISPDFFNANPSFINRGISGQTTSQMLTRFRQDVIELNPDVVIILAGINDIAENNGPISIEAIAGNIYSMVELAKANHITPVLCSVLPANRIKWKTTIKPADKVIELNKLIKHYAKKHKIEYVDYYRKMADSQKGLKIEYGDDGVHPNLSGYKVMEPILEKTLEKVNKSR